jgi:hypothetical protein
MNTTHHRPYEPILPIPERLWACYSPFKQWYSWVYGYDLTVTRVGQGWDWMILHAGDGHLLACSTEADEYPTVEDAMGACEHGFRRFIEGGAK